jgi:hypothetical protein
MKSLHYLYHSFFCFSNRISYEINANRYYGLQINCDNRAKTAFFQRFLGNSQIFPCSSSTRASTGGLFFLLFAVRGQTSSEKRLSSH